MKIPFLSKAASILAQYAQLEIVIVDDNSSYFDDAMVKAAKTHGLGRIKRLYQVDRVVLNQLVQNPPDVVILDVKGTTSADVAKDGLELAAHLFKTTSSYIVVTSAHKHHLSNRTAAVDYVMEQRLLTVVDFLHELRQIRDDCMSRKKRFYQNIGLRAAMLLGRMAATSGN